MDSPAAHVVVTRSVTDPESSVWIRRAVAIVVAMVALGVLAWQRSGLALVGIALVAIASLVVFAPPSVQGFRNAVAAARENAWVSGTVEASDGGGRSREALVVLDTSGVTLVDGPDFTGTSRQTTPWDAVTDVRLFGPTYRPHRMQVDGPSVAIEVAGPLGTDLFDRLSQLGAEIPNA